MTSQSDASVIDEWIVVYSALFVNGYCAIAVTALTVYDWIVTLSREVQLFWAGKARPISAILYFSNKYLNLFTLAIATHLWQAPLSEQGVVFMGRVITYLSLIPPAMFAGLRTYALTQSYWLLTLVLLLANTQFVTNMAVTFPLWVVLNTTHCLLLWVESVRTVLVFEFHRMLIVHLTVLIVTRISAILADVLLIAITIWKLRHESFAKTKSQRKAVVTGGLASIMLYNGILYFAVLVILNTLHLVLTEVSKGVEGPTSLVSNFTIPLSSILVSHFLLDLQEASQRSAVGLGTKGPSDTSQSVSMQSVNFASALGSLGATVDPGLADVYDDDEAASDDPSTTSQSSLPDDCESSRHAGIEDAFVIMEVPRGGSSGVLRS